MKPIVYMLCGLTGSGKTTYAKKLENTDLIRLSIDEIIFERHGAYGIDYPEDQYFGYLKPATLELKKRLIDRLKDKKSAIIDTGFWTKAERDEYKEVIEKNGGEWKLLYFKTSPDVLSKRLEKRNQQSDANALIVTKEALNDF
ncbi:MAG: ATP-binding protein, partial [bacterium]